MKTLSDEVADPMTSYAIRGGEQGKARLRVIWTALRPSTLGFLDRAGIAPGMACLDLGCGTVGHSSTRAPRAARRPSPSQVVAWPG